jgi:hypothetical protein
LETLTPMRASNIVAHIIVEEAVKLASNNENAVPADHLAHLSHHDHEQRKFSKPSSPDQN